MFPPRVCWGGGGGGGGGQASCLVAKQAVEFPQVLPIVSYVISIWSQGYRQVRILLCMHDV